MLLTPEVCQYCFQKKQCGMKNRTGALSTAEVVDGRAWVEAGEPTACWFYTCAGGHMEARHALRKARSR